VVDSVTILANTPISRDDPDGKLAALPSNQFPFAAHVVAPAVWTPTVAPIPATTKELAKMNATVAITL
jgi:hypothetical protein